MNIVSKVVVSVFASSVAKPFFPLGGTLLKLFGKMVDYYPAYLLGHYIQGSGEDVSLPERFYEELRFEANCSESATNLKKEGVCMPIHFPNGDGGFTDELFYSIGKYHYEIKDGMLHIWDKYMFYQTCPHDLTHFDDCDCPVEIKAFKSLDKRFSFARKMPVKQSHTVVIKFASTSHLCFTVHRDGFSVSCDISDGFWVDKGKPFTVRASIPLEGA